MLLREVNPALALVASVFLTIFNPAAAQDNGDTRVFRSRLSTPAILRPHADISIENSSWVPGFIYSEEISGRNIPVAFSIEDGRVRIRNGDSPSSGVIAVYRNQDSGIAQSPPEVRVDGEIVAGTWEDNFPMILSELDSITDSLANGTVGVIDTHTVGFNTTSDPLSDSAIIWVTLPSGFAFGPLEDTAYFDDDPANDVNEPIITSVTIEGQLIKFQLNSGAQQAVPGSRISIRFGSVTSSTVAGYYSVGVATTNADGDIENGPGLSEPFYLTPDVLDAVTVDPDTSMSAPSDTIINFSAAGFDQYGNLIPDVDFAWDVTVDSCGDVFDGAFHALKVGGCYVTASSGGLSDSSGAISVVPGSLGRFSLTGYPAQTDAGIHFIIPVNVTAYDVNDNKKTDYSGSVWFTSTDPWATLPFTAGSPYTFDVGDAGSHNFPGAGFILRQSGLKTITVTDGIVSTISNYINVRSGVIVSFTLSAPSPQLAGVSFNLQASGALDSLGNFASGEIIVSDSIGGGNSPDGIPPSYNRIIVGAGFGSAFQTLTNAVPTVLQGTASGSFAIAATDTIVVEPGNLGRFEMDGYPDSALAGASFPNPGVTVAVFDLFGNDKTNYSDSVYFSSTDPLAALPYTSSSWYRYVVSDSGSHIFPGPGFILYTAGNQHLTVTDNTFSDVSGAIHVSPGLINSFMIFATSDTIAAGIPFAVSVTGCRDAWGNLTNGSINVADSVGGGNSPNGSSPIFNAIRVSGGLGSSNQTLVNTVPTILKGYTVTVIAVTQSIYVMPGDAGEFSVDISSPQFSGIPFSNTALVTAFDYFGNIKTDYDASVDTVVISSSAGGLMANNVLRTAGSFTSGVADLTALNTTYIGRGGNMTFSALSQSGVSGVSGTVNVRGISCDGLIIDQGVVSWGDTATGAVGVTNEGGVAVEITDLDVFSDGGIGFEPSIIVPGLPDSLGPGINRLYDIYIPIHGGLGQGSYPLTASASGLFGTYAVYDTLGGYPDTIMIQRSSVVGYVDGSLRRDTLSTGEIYSLAIELNNTGGAGVTLIDTSYVYFSDGTRDYNAALRDGAYLPPDHPSGISVQFDSVQVAPDFVAGDYQVEFYYFGHENGHMVVDTLNLTDLVTIQNSASISYIAGSVNVDTLVAGQPWAFDLRLNNSGTASFEIDQLNTILRFSDGVRLYAAYPDTAPGARIDFIQPGDTTFYFESATLSQEFVPGRYLPVITMRGRQNGIPQSFTLSTAPDSLDVISRGSIGIDTTVTRSLNAPFVNTGQPCSLHVAVVNYGDEDIDSVYVKLTSDGSSAFADSALLGAVGGHSFRSIDYQLNASNSPDSGEILVSSIAGGHGRISRLPPQVRTPLDNAAILIIETPAELALSPLSVIRPPGAEDDTVTIGQPVTIAATVRNLGQAAINGARRLVLDTLNSGFTVADSLNRDYNLAEQVSWDITAPPGPDNSTVLTVRFAAFPTDANDGSGAVGPDSVSSIDLTVVTTPSVVQTPAIDSPPGAVDGVLSADQMLIFSNTVQAFGEYYDLSTTILLPFGYTTNDSITKYPVGGPAVWNVRAPGNAFLDSIEFSSRLFDINTGQPYTAGPDFIRVETVPASNLELITGIAGPNAALDGIIDPGAYLIFEAVVINNGQAGTGSGMLSLHIGNPELFTSDQIIRQFTIGQPISWIINAPDREISTAVPIWASLDSIPDDENTNSVAGVVNDSSGVLVSVRELRPRLEFSTLMTHSGSVVKGQQLPYLEFELSNNDRGGSFMVGLTRLTISAGWHPDDQPAPFSGMVLFADSVLVSNGQINGTEISLDLTDTLRIDPGQNASFSLRLGILANTRVGDFVLSVESGAVEGVIFDEGIIVDQITAVSPDDSPLWKSPRVAILEQSFAGSVSSYPNPFNPDRTEARIGYYLDSDSELNLRIFTLLGDLVWTKIILAGDPLGRAGLHTGNTAVIWDGRNDSGYEVHSGVYICVIENVSAGQEEKLKIAIVK